jgi:hypothetical protein
MTIPDESRAARRTRLHHEFLQLASDVQRLRDAPAPAASHLARWQNIYATDAALVIERYEEITKPGAMPSSSTLEEWIADTRRVLAVAHWDSGTH